MFATGTDRCPVQIFKFYLSKRPIDLRNKGPFYLGIIKDPANEDIWFKKSPILSRYYLDHWTYHNSWVGSIWYGDEEQQQEISNKIDNLNNVPSAAPSHVSVNCDETTHQST